MARVHHHVNIGRKQKFQRGTWNVKRKKNLFDCPKNRNNLTA